MKAIRVHEFGGPEVLKLEEVPRMSPGPNEALIQVKAVGVNPVETYIRAGTYARKPPLPFTPGQNCNVQKIRFSRKYPRTCMLCTQLTLRSLSVFVPV